MKTHSQVSTKSLINSDRIDVVAKLLLAKELIRYNGMVSNWVEDLYSEHIRIMNGFIEGDGTKLTRNDFFSSYFNLIKSIEKTGFSKDISIIPVSNDGVILDGAHRLAASLAFGQNNIYINETDKPKQLYDLDFFSSRGLPQEYCDYLAYEYCKLSPNTRVVLLYPSAKGNNEQVEKLLETKLKIVYKKNIYINQKGSLNLIRQVYYREPWLGNWRNDFSGAQEKAWACFVGDGLLRVYVVETSNPEILILLKQKIRDIFQIGKHSIHISDLHEETIFLTKILLNNNTIHYLNYSQPVYYDWFYSLLDDYSNTVLARNSECYCIDGSGVLAIYGARPARDLDYICLVDELSINIEDVNCHNKEWEIIGMNYTEVIKNPLKHFYYLGIKFCSLPELVKFKEKRNEIKDKKDILIINSISEKDPTIKNIRKSVITSPDLLIYRIKTIIKFLIPSKVLKKLLKIRMHLQRYILRK